MIVVVEVLRLLIEPRHLISGLASRSCHSLRLVDMSTVWHLLFNEAEIAHGGDLLPEIRLDGEYSVDLVDQLLVGEGLVAHLVIVVPRHGSWLEVVYALLL